MKSISKIMLERRLQRYKRVKNSICKLTDEEIEAEYIYFSSKYAYQRMLVSFLGVLSVVTTALSFYPCALLATKFYELAGGDFKGAAYFFLCVFIMINMAPCMLFMFIWDNFKTTAERKVIFEILNKKEKNI